MILTIGSLGTPQKSDSPMPSVRPATCLQVIEANFRICILFDFWWIFGRFAQIEVVGTLPNSPLSSWNELRILWSSYFLILLLLLGRSSRPCFGSFKDVFEAAQVGPLHCRGLCFATAGSWSCWTHEHELRASCLQAWKLLCPAGTGLWTPQVSTPVEIAHNKLQQIQNSTFSWAQENHNKVRTWMCATNIVFVCVCQLLFVLLLCVFVVSFFAFPVPVWYTCFLELGLCHPSWMMQTCHKACP